MFCRVVDDKDTHFVEKKKSKEIKVETLYCRWDKNVNNFALLFCIADKINVSETNDFVKL